MDTKENIRLTALRLFSERGFEGVSMRDIAAAVGIKAASIYNHFKSKEEIFASLLEEMDKSYETMMAQIVSGKSAEEMAAFCLTISEEQLTQMAAGIFHYFLKDDFAAPLRRMVTAEQFRSTVAGENFRKTYLSGAISFQAGVFSALMGLGVFIKADPEIAALQFYAPVFMLLSYYDGKPEMEQEAVEKLTRHVHWFNEFYRTKE